MLAGGLLVLTGLVLAQPGVGLEVTVTSSGGPVKAGDQVTFTAAAKCDGNPVTTNTVFLWPPDSAGSQNSSRQVQAPDFPTMMTQACQVTYTYTSAGQSWQASGEGEGVVSVAGVGDYTGPSSVAVGEAADCTFAVSVPGTGGGANSFQVTVTSPNNTVNGSSVTFLTVGDHPVIGTLGTHSNSATVKAVGMGTVTASPLLVAEGTSVAATANPDPAGANWPQGKPVWTASAGTVNGSGGSVSVLCTATGDNVISASCGTSSNKVTVKVVGVESVSNSATVVVAGASVTATAKPKPAGSSWPSGQPVWGGAASGTGASVPFTASTPGSNTVSASCGTSSNSATLVVVGIASISGPTNAFVGSSVTYSTAAIPSGTAFPSGWPQWKTNSSAAGSGSATLTLITPSNTAPLGITASCGTSSNSITLQPLSVTLSNVTFNGTSGTILKDDGSGAYPDPHWLNGRSVQSPVLYKMGDKPQVTASFNVSPGTFSGSFKIKGTISGDSYSASLPEQQFAVASGVVTYTGTADVEFKEVRKFAPLSITWTITTTDGLSSRSLSSQHPVYVSLQQPVASTVLLHTVVDIACRGGNGEKDIDKCIDGIWKIFESRIVKRVDGTLLKYYGSYNTINTRTPGLIKDGDGQCGSWASFYLDTLKIHGFQESANYLFLVPEGLAANYMFVSNWRFSGSGSSGDRYFPYKNVFSSRQNTYYVWRIQEVYDEAGIPGQSVANPASLFNNHQVAVIKGIIYDPSYGKKYSSRDVKEVDQFCISGYGLSNGNLFKIRKNDDSIELKGRYEDY